ncbi:MAG: pyridoxamine 5'-phosphate oxidase family protein [Actinomycetota bacterium]|nr:pyridoxamine 5'-phosphate oxidase family protein [Actinomycetota bacterium]
MAESAEVGAEFDLDAFLAKPLVARIATQGPTIRPVWFLWEEGGFWWITGTWSRLPDRLRHDPSVALVVDTCDLASGEVLEVFAKGRAEILPYHRERAGRLLRRYLGNDENSWDPRFFLDTIDPATRFVRLRPTWLRTRDLSYTPSDNYLRVQGLAPKAGGPQA